MDSAEPVRTENDVSLLGPLVFGVAPADGTTASATPTRLTTIAL